MSQSSSLPDPLDLTRALDRLVAGELATSDRQALLQQLDATPDGWRQCALAFLEDQAWRTALSESVPTAHTHMAATQGVTLKNQRGSFIRWKQTAIAAGLMLAVATACFQIGVRITKRSESVSTASVASETPRLLSQIQEEPGQALGWIGLAGPADGEAFPRQVPVLAATAANQQWVEMQPAELSEYVKAQWERRGFEVEENHRLVGLDLQDGRRVAVPVDEVALNYVGHQPL